MHKVEYETIHAVVNIHGSELQSTIQSIGTIQSTALQVIQSQSGGSVDRLIPSRNDHTQSPLHAHTEYMRRTYSMARSR